MGTEARKLPGERILERLERRSRRRPRMGLVPEFYARLGVEDPWQEGQAAEAGGEGLVFLSASPFYQALRRLANARRRRERRTERFLDRRAGATLRAATRRLPGEARLAGVGGLPGFGAAALRDDAMRFYTPASMVAAAPESTVRVISGWGEPSGEPTSAWLKTPYVPARTVRATPAMTAAGDRLNRAAAGARVDRALAAAPVAVLPKARHALTTSIVEEDAPLTTRTVIRRVRHAAPMVEEIVVHDAPRIRPMRQAVERRAESRGAGLRPVLSGSPSIALRAGAALDHAMAMAQVAPERLEAGRPAAARRIRASARVAARDTTGRPNPRLSASPVLSAARVATPAPAASEPGPARRASGAAAARLGVVRLGQHEGSIDGEAVQLETVGIAARVAARSASTSQSLVPRMARASVTMRMPERAEPTSSAATAKTKDGLFLPAREVQLAALESTARTFRTPSGDRTAATVARTPEAAFQGAASRVTPTGAHAPAQSVRTADSAWRAARASTTAGSAWEGATIGRAADRAWSGASLHTTADAAWSGAAARRTGASPWEGASAAHTASVLWAAARIGGESESSLMPRIAPAGPSRVLPRHAPQPEARPAERVAANPWATTDTTPARTVRTAATRYVAARVVRSMAAEAASPAPRLGTTASASVSASARAFRTPTVSTAGARVARQTTAPSVPGPRPLTGPLAYAGPTVRGLRTPDLAWARAAVARGGDRAEILRTVIGAIEEKSGPLGAVRTPDGRFVSARTAVSMAAKWDGARSLTTESAPFTGARTGITLPDTFSGARRGATPELAFARASMVRTPDGAWASAATTSTPESLFAGASTSRTRPTDWAGARSAVGETTAYRGALAARTPDARFNGAATGVTPDGVFVAAARGTTPGSRFDGAGRFRTADGTFLGAARGTTPDTTFQGAGSSTTAATDFRGASARRTPDGRFDGAGRYTTGATPFEGASVGAAGTSGYTGGTRRPANTTAASDFAYPEREERAGEASQPGTRRRTSVFDTAAQLVDGDVGGAAPTWAARSTGEPRVRSGDGLFDALAKATSANEVVRVIFERAEGLRRSGPLPEPLMEVVQEIQREVVRVPVQSSTLQTQRPIQVESPRVTTLARPASAPRSTTRRVRSSAAPAQASARTATGGRNDRLSKLVKRLNDLIHLAENQRMGEALREVRLAEDTPTARAEGSAPLSGTGTDPKELEKVDQDALTREVVHEVIKLLEQNRERHAEDSDESNWW